MPRASRRRSASSPKAARNICIGDMKASAPLGVELIWLVRGGGVLALEAVEPVPAPLRYELPYLDVVLLAGALLVGAHGVAVERARLPGPLSEQGGYPVLVGD